jgi:hypothetical protein
VKKFLKAHPFEPETITIEDTPDKSSHAVVLPRAKPRALSDLSEQEQMEHAIKESLKEETGMIVFLSVFWFS